MWYACCAPCPPPAVVAATASETLVAVFGCEVLLNIAAGSDLFPSPQAPHLSSHAGPFRPLRIVSYNIFLGQNLQGLIAELGALNPTPDVILLQEDNVYEDRTGGLPVLRHAGGAIAKALRMACIFTPAYFRGMCPCVLPRSFGTSHCLNCLIAPPLSTGGPDWSLNHGHGL